MTVLRYRRIEKDPDSEWVVFLHGIGGGSSIWFKQIKDFREYFNILLVDLPGHGGSDYGLIDMEDTSFYQIAREVLKVLEVNGIKKAHFVGISLGTIVAQTVHDLSPHHVSSMVLGGAVEKLNLPAKLIVQVAKLLKNFVPYMVLYRICAWILMPKKHHKEARLAFVKEAIKLGQKEFLKWFDLHSQIEPLFTKIRKNIIPVPKLYVMGSEDYMFLPMIKKRVEGARDELLQIIEKCGHVCNIEQAKEFNELAINFIHSISSSTKSPQSSLQALT